MNRRCDGCKTIFETENLKQMLCEECRPAQSLVAVDQVVPAPVQSTIKRTSEGLRNALFDEIDAIRNGTSDIGRAKTIAALASQIISAVRMEMDYRAKSPEEELLKNPIKLGTS